MNANFSIPIKYVRYIVILFLILAFVAAVLGLKEERNFFVLACIFVQALMNELRIKKLTEICENTDKDK